MAWWGDFTGNGNLDFATSMNGNPPEIIIAYGNGNGTLQPPVTYYAPSGTGDNLVVGGDLNGDGRPDLVETGNGSVYVMLTHGGPLSSGTHTFTAWEADVAGNSSAVKAPADDRYRSGHLPRRPAWSLRLFFSGFIQLAISALPGRTALA